jgi:hypothetical protein
MAKSDLLKEAIADARAVKETALANAKIALQEAFAPRLERMLATKLTNEIEGEEESQEPNLDDMGDDVPVEDETTDGAVDWIDNDISFSVGGNTYDAEIDNSMEDEQSMEEPEMGGEKEAPMSNDEMSDEYNENHEMEDDLNLEEIIRELEGDLDEPMAEPEMEEPMAEGEYEMPEDIEEDMNIDEIIESILREEEDGDIPTSDAGPEAEEVAELEEKLEDTEGKLEEAYNTVRQLKSIINEVNLLNAKLLYTNKLFRNFELSENQKMKVIENFDRAGNTREVKLVFSTLAESFKRPTTKKRVVKESYASKPVATTAPKSTNIINEGFDQAERWKKLAGLL